MRKSLTLILLTIIWISCENSSDAIPEVPQDLIDKSLELFDGNVTERESEQENGVDSWEIKIENENGSVVKFYWPKNGQTLIKMEGQTGPFNYNINIGNNLINLRTAQTVAKSAVKNDNVSKWKLEQDDDFIGKWVYSFELDDVLTTVIIDAENGDILETN